MPARPALLGELLDGRYRIDSPIARGGMSTVYRGTDTRLDRPVAVKVMDPSFADDPEFQARFELEARSIARLSHSGLVAVHDQGTDDGRAFLVMELVEGGTVRELLRERGRLDLPQALAVLEPALAALSTAHRAGLVHRDVKPENVLVRDDGTVKVADFGLVRAVAAAGATSHSGMILGTVAYLSPEQVTTGDADARSDVYSAGVLLFELLTGAPPFSGDTPLSVAYQHVNAEVPAPSSRVPGIPPEVDAVVRRATRRDPAQRFRDAGELLGEVITLRRVLSVPRVRLQAPVRSAEHATSPSTALRPPQPHQTRALTTGVGPSGARPPSRTLEPTVTDRVPPVRDYAHDRRRARRTALVWVLVVALVTAAVGVGAWWLGSGQFTTVPEVGGLERAAAEQVLDEADLDVVVRTGYDDTAARDLVLTADPGAGTQLERGSDVVLTVSLGRPLVPEIAVGTGGPVVDQLLTEVTLRPEATGGGYDDAVPAGALLALDPPAGTELAVGSAVRVTLSLGPAPVDVPDVAGRSVADATAALAAAGLTAGSTAEEFSGQVPGGAVVRTDPPSGGEAPRGSAVTLVVSTALTVPDVTGQSADQAGQTLRDAGFEPVDGGTTSDGDAPAGAVAATSPSAGTLVDPAAAQVQVVVSDAVTVPGLFGTTVGSARAQLAELGLLVEVDQLLPTDTAFVVAQDPDGGTRVPPGTTVTLTALP